MNKKIFIVLALASLFVSTHAAIGQIVCKNAAGATDAGCASCPNSAAGSCTTCKTGYFKETNAAGLATCTSCGTGCDACTSATVCTTAADGYFLSSGAATSCAQTGCKTCTSATVCTAPLPGYVIVSNAPVGCDGTTSVTAYTCNVCTAAASGSCTTPADGYFLASGVPTSCAQTGCKTCTSATVCTAPLPGYVIVSNAPVGCDGTTSVTAYTCNVCTAAAAGSCTTAATGYFLASGTPSQCADAVNAAGCTAQYTVTTCTFGTIDTQTMCCGVQGCATCGAPATVADSNNVCATCSEGYLLSSGACTACTATNCATCPTGVATCATCKSGYTLTGSGSTATCVASTPVPATSSPSSAFNVTPALVYTSTDTTAPAFSAVESATTIYGPGFDSTTAYVWLVVKPTVSTGTVAVNRREVNTTAFTKSNSTADAAITTSIPYAARNTLSYGIGPGYLLIGSVTAGLNWGVATATASEVYLTYIASNGTATTKAITSNTNTNVFFDVKNVFFLNGTAYVVYVMKTHTAGTVSTPDSWALNGIYIHGVVLSTGTLLNYTTGGVKAISLTQTSTGTVNGVSSNTASEPSSQVSSFSVGAQNFTQNADTVWYLWDDQSTSTAKTIKLGSINVTTGAATSGTTLTTTTSVSTGTGTAADPTITTYYSIAGFHGSDSGSFGAYINKRVTSAITGGATTTTSTVLSFINGTSTAQTTLYSLTPPTGYTSTSVNGFGTEDGFILVQTAYSQATTTPAQPISAQAQRFYTNGTAVTTSAVALGTYSASPIVYQDTNGTIVFGYTLADTLSPYKTYSGYLGSYVVQAMAASTLTSIFAFLSLMIVALFAF